MGWHLCVYGTNYSFKNIKNPVVDLKDEKKFKELLTGHDANAGIGRSVFTNAMFTTNDVIPILKIKDREENYSGYQSTKIDMISNFYKWSISKSNPFREIKFFKECSSIFLKRINIVLKGFKFYFYDDSIIQDFVNFNENKYQNQLKYTAKFYGDIRSGKKPNLEIGKVALNGSFWKYKKNGLCEFVDDYLIEEFESYKSANEACGYFYGDI